MNKPKNLYSNNDEYCFYHFNRFLLPKKLQLKEISIAEGYDNNTINYTILKNNLLRIIHHPNDKKKWLHFDYSIVKVNYKLESVKYKVAQLRKPRLVPRPNV